MVCTTFVSKLYEDKPRTGGIGKGGLYATATVIPTGLVTYRSKIACDVNMNRYMHFVADFTSLVWATLALQERLTKNADFCAEILNCEKKYSWQITFFHACFARLVNLRKKCDDFFKLGKSIKRRHRRKWNLDHIITRRYYCIAVTFYFFRHTVASKHLTKKNNKKRRKG